MLLTIAQQKLLVLMLEKNGITRREQKIFKSRKFYDAIHYLQVNSLIKLSVQNGNEKRWKLTLEGEIVAMIFR